MTRPPIIGYIVTTDPCGPLGLWERRGHPPGGVLSPQESVTLFRTRREAAAAVERTLAWWGRVCPGQLSEEQRGKFRIVRVRGR